MPNQIKFYKATQRTVHHLFPSRLNVIDSLANPPYNEIEGGAMDLSKDALTTLICHHCDFYKDSEKDLECGAYRILKGLLRKGKITPREIEDALRE